MLAISYMCPCCHAGRLDQDGSEALICPRCSRAFPVVNGCPILINDTNSVFAISDYTAQRGYDGNAYVRTVDKVGGFRALYRRLARSLTNCEAGMHPFDGRAAISEIGRLTEGTPRILVVGAGDLGFGGSGNHVRTDVTMQGQIDCICDAHDLPFGDGEFDAVVAVAVLEHVADPQRCVDEMWRVLRPAGYVYASSPFLFPVHMGAYDFTRFTYLGHRRLFRRFDDIRSGVALGPGAAIAKSLQYALPALVANRHLQRLLRLIGLLLSVPLRALDRWSLKHEASYDAAAGLFFFGRRSEHVVSDRELIKLYRGAQK